MTAAAPADPSVPTPEQRARRQHRLLWIGGVIGVVLVVYALGLNWAANRLETDVQDSIRPVTQAQPDQH